MTNALIRAASLARHPAHTVRSAFALASDRPPFSTARETWRRLWIEERPLADVSAIDPDQGTSSTDQIRRVRIGGRERDAVVLRAPASRVWQTRSAVGGEVRLWCAVMPGEWASGATADVTLCVSSHRDETVTVALAPRRAWAHRRWILLRAPTSGPVQVRLDVAGDGRPVEVAIAGAGVRWRRPPAEVRALLRAFVHRVRKGGLRDTARWAERSARQRDDRVRYQQWCARHTPDAQALAAMARGLQSWSDRPRFSVLTPVYNTDPAWLEACIESVRAQVYPDWELLLSDDGSTREETRAVLRSFESDPRIQVIWNEKNRGIAAATQAALDRASGDYIAMLDHDDAVLPHALYRAAARLKSVPDADLVYSDEDKLELDGSRSDVYFKPDWSPDLFLSSMYVCHFLVMRRRLVVEAGGFRPGFDGSQDYDLVLRVIERARRIEHIADVLYHWRKIPESASATGAAKPWAHLAGQRALQDYADRNALDARVEDAGAPGLYRMRYRVRGAPRVSVISTKPGLVSGAGLRQRDPVSFIEPILVERAGTEAEMLNAGAAAATGDFLLFVGPNVTPQHADWIEAMLEHAQRPEVGAVGAKLFYPDGRLRHIGLVVGADGAGRRPFDGYPGTWAGYFSNANAIRNCLAVSRSAVMLSRAAFEKAGGWRDALDLDVDLGRRVWDAGLRVVFTPYARLTESTSAGERPETTSRPPRRPPGPAGNLDRDPYYNLHFAAESADYLVRVD